MGSIVRRLWRSSCLRVVVVLILGLSTANAQKSGSTLPGRAGNQTFRVGGKSIAIPSPAKDLVEIGSDYRVLLQPLAPDTNRLIAAFVPPDYVQEVRSGHPPRLSFYALAEVVRRAEFLDLSPKTFKQITSRMSQQFGSAINGSLKSQEADFNRRMKDLNSHAASVTFDKPVPLGTLFSKQNSWAYGMIVPISAKGVKVTRAMGAIVLRVQDRLLIVYLYRRYQDASTARWLRTACEKWAGAILSANQ